MRAVLVVGVLAAAAAAKPVFVAKGDTLEAFDMTADLAAVDRSSPRALAESFAGMLGGLDAIRRRLPALIEAGHLRVLDRHCAGAVAKVQREAYGARRRAPVLRFRVASVEGDCARVAVEGDPRYARTYELLLREKDGGWWARATDSLTPESLLGPDWPETEVPAPAAADLSTPAAAVASYRRDVRRLEALRLRAVWRLHRVGGDTLVRALFGDEAAAAAKPGRIPAAPEVHHVFGSPEVLATGETRIVVTAQEEVPDRHGVRSAVGQAAFDLRRDEGGRWRIVAEWAREKPRKPLVRQDRSFGLFFAR